MLRSTDRSKTRRTICHATRMLNGARRQRPPNYFALFCRAFEEVLRLNKLLAPFLEEQYKLHQEEQWRQQCRAAIDRIYGPDTSAPLRTASMPLNSQLSALACSMSPREVRKHEKALAHAQATLAVLRSKIGQKW